MNTFLNFFTTKAEPPKPSPQVLELTNALQQIFPKLCCTDSSKWQHNNLLDVKQPLLDFLGRLKYLGVDNVEIGMVDESKCNILVTQAFDIKSLQSLLQLPFPTVSLNVSNLNIELYWNGTLELRIDTLKMQATCSQDSILSPLAKIGFAGLFKDAKQISSHVKHVALEIHVPHESSKFGLALDNVNMEEGNGTRVLKFPSFRFNAGLHAGQQNWPLELMNMVASINANHEIRISSKSTEIVLDTIYAATTLDRFAKFMFLLKDSVHELVNVPTAAVKLTVNELMYSIANSERDLKLLWTKHEKQQKNAVPNHDFGTLKGNIKKLVFEVNEAKKFAVAIDEVSLVECYTDGSVRKEYEVFRMEKQDSPCVRIVGNQAAINVLLHSVHINLHSQLYPILWKLFSSINLATLSFSEYPSTPTSDENMDTLNEMIKESRKIIWVTNSVYISLQFVQSSPTNERIYLPDMLQLNGSNLKCLVTENSSGEDYEFAFDELGLSVQSSTVKRVELLMIQHPVIKLSKSEAEKKVGNALYSAMVYGEALLKLCPSTLQELIRIFNMLFAEQTNLAPAESDTISDLDINFSLERLEMELNSLQLPTVDKSHNYHIDLNVPVGSIRIKFAPLTYDLNCKSLSIELYEEEDEILKTVNNISAESHKNTVSIKYSPGVIPLLYTSADLACIYWKFSPCLPENCWLTVLPSLFRSATSTQFEYDVKVSDMIIDYIPKLLESRLMASIGCVHVKGKLNSSSYKMNLSNAEVLIHPKCQQSVQDILNSTSMSLESGILKYLKQFGFCTVLNTNSLAINYQHSPFDIPKYVYEVTGGDIHYHLCFDSLNHFLPLFYHLMQQVDINADLYTKNEEELKKQAEIKKKKDEEERKRLEAAQSAWGTIKGWLYNTDNELPVANAGKLFQVGASVASASHGVGIPAFPAPDMPMVTLVRIGSSEDLKKKVKPVNLIIHCYAGDHFGTVNATPYLDICLLQVAVNYVKYNEYDPNQFGLTASIEHIQVNNLCTKTILLQAQKTDKENPDANCNLVYSAKVHHLSATILPMRLDFDFASGCYMNELFQALISACSSIPESGPSMIFRNFFLNDLEMRINYQSSDVTNVSALAQGNTSELAKFANLHDAPFSFSPISFQNTTVTSFSKILSLVKTSFTNDLCSSKLVMLAFGTLPFTAVRVFSKGAYNFVAIPVQEMANQDGSLWVGICKGLASMTNNTIAALATVGKMAIQVPSIVFKNVLIAQQAATTTETQTTTEQAPTTEYAMFVIPKDEQVTVARTVITKIVGGVDAVDEHLTKIANKLATK